MRVGELVAGFLVPGLAVHFRGPRLWGCAALAGSAALLLAYLVWLGYPAANLAFGFLISLHVSGFVYYCNPLMAREPLRSRLAFTLLVMIALTLLLYWPLRGVIQQHLLVPLRMNGTVIVVQRFLPAPVVRRGDWIAYTLASIAQGEAENGGAIRFHGGTGLGPVLAVAGDRLSFSNHQFAVNGVWQTDLPHMPPSGELVVPEKHWFIWPNLAISGHGNVREESISATLLRLADVSPEQYLGRPLRRWVWRKQILP